MNAADCIKRLIDLKAVVASYVFFTEAGLKAELEPGTPGMRITFPDGSIGYYTDGDYWVHGSLPPMGSRWEKYYDVHPEEKVRFLTFVPAPDNRGV